MSAIELVSRDAWSYGGDFYVETSGHNRHRRATLPELKSHFDTSSDQTAHWYEAQLLHYGLPPSKTKGTAKMRLFEAVQKGSLAVPGHIVKVESELKKEWAKKKRAAKQALKKQAEASTPSNRDTKRKADTTPAIHATNFTLNLSFSVGPQGSLQITPADSSPAPKKAKATPAKDPNATTKVASAKTTPAQGTKPTKTTTTKASTAKTTSAKKPTQAVSLVSENSPPSRPHTKQTARRSRPFGDPGHRAGSTRPVPSVDLTSSSSPRRPQAARRANPVGLASRGGRQTITRGGTTGLAMYSSSSSSRSESNDEPPPPYSLLPPRSSQSHPVEVDDDDSSLRPLGLLNGRYEIHVTGPSYLVDKKGGDSGMIMTLDGNALWCSVEIGPITGVFRLENRPRQASHHPLHMEWRCEDEQGGDHAGSGQKIWFLGGGEIRGEMPFYNGDLEFEGHRISGQETRSEISAFNMKKKWDELGRQVRR